MNLQSHQGLAIIHCRTRLSSNEEFRSKFADVQEALRLLSAIEECPGTTVQILLVGIDAFTTNLESLEWVSQEFAKLDTRMVYITQTDFPGSKKQFPVLSNGIRYGQFKLANIMAVQASPDINGYDGPKEVVEALELIRAGKRMEERNRMCYKDLTTRENSICV